MADSKTSIINGALDRRAEILRANNLRENPFVKTPLPDAILDQVFVGREREIVDAAMRLADRSRNLLVVGDYGYGKTTFLRKLLRELTAARRKRFMCGYGVLNHDSPQGLQLAALTALAEAAVDVAPPGSPLRDYALSVRLELSRVVPGTETTAIPDLRFRDGLKFAREAGIERVVIAIDEIDKRDAAVLQSILMGARYLLDLDCAFILTGRPLDIFADPRSSLLAAFDHRIELHPFAAAESLEIIRRNIVSARIDPDAEGAATCAPFTDGTTQAIVEQSHGLPRPLNLVAGETLELALHEAIRRGTTALVIERTHMEQALINEGNLIYNQVTARARRLLSELFRRNGYVSGSDLDVVSPDGSSQVTRELDRLSHEDAVVRLAASDGPAFALSPQIGSSLADTRDRRTGQKSLWSDAEFASTPHDRGRALEDFAASLFSEAFEITKRNLRTDTEELDLVVRATAATDPPFPSASLLIVECKNWASAVGQNTVSELVGKLHSHRLTHGLILARGRFSPEAIQQARYARPEYSIVLIDGETMSQFLDDVLPLSDLIVALYDQLVLRSAVLRS